MVVSWLMKLIFSHPLPPSEKPFRLLDLPCVAFKAILEEMDIVVVTSSDGLVSTLKYVLNDSEERKAVRDIIAMFRIKSIAWRIRLEDNQTLDMRQLTGLPFHICKKFKLSGGSVDKVCLRFIISRLNANTKLQIYSEIPVDFRCDEALKFSNCLYKDGRWMTTELLMSMRECQSLVLLRTNLKFEDVNHLLHHWADFDTFDELNVQLVDSFIDNTPQELDYLVIDCTTYLMIRKKRRLIERYSEIRQLDSEDIEVERSQIQEEFDSVVAELIGAGVCEFGRELQSAARFDAHYIF
uniref:FBA_2 domain-containing protein n=1 Tax=Caenorhabditis tropicalis TaxID=1561998 RepID=A0A1I7USG7_9PELO